MRKFLSISLILIILLLSNTPYIKANDDSPFSYVVIDRLTGDILLGKNANELIYPASTTKILTGIVALENSGLSSYLTTSRTAAGPLELGAVRLGLVEGEKMQLYDLMHALLLKSANDAAIVIAENITNSIDAFATLSNEFAYNIGAKNTHFTNPNGLHSDEHYTTAYDLAIITNYALKNYTFSSIVSKRDYKLNSTNEHDTFPRLVNSNPILGKNDGYDFLVTGVKTGYTHKAKYVLVSSARNYDGREVVCVVTGCETRLQSGKYSLDLINKAFNNFAYQSIVHSGDIVYTYHNNIDIPLAASFQIDYLLPTSTDKWKLEHTINIYKNSNMLIQRGDILGEITYIYNNKTIGQSYLVSTITYSKTNKNTDSFFLLTTLNNTKKSNQYILFIISLIWVILLLVLFFSLFSVKKIKYRSDDNV